MSKITVSAQLDVPDEATADEVTAIIDSYIKSTFDNPDVSYYLVDVGVQDSLCAGMKKVMFSADIKNYTSVNETTTHILLGQSACE